MPPSEAKPFVAPQRRADEWLTFGKFALLLGALFLLTFPRVIAGLEAFSYLDSGLFAYPVAFYHRECFWRGELPLWNPLSSCGVPFLAQWNTLTLYPLSLLYLTLPVPWSFGVFCLAQLFLGGLGMYSLAHRWTGSRLAAGVAGAIFAFNGLAWYGLMWPNIVAALGWMPWLVLAAERAWLSGGRALVVASLIGGIQMLTGGAEVILLTWFLLGALWMWHLLHGATRRRVLLVRFVLVAALAAGLAAAQLLPFLDLLAHSQRGADYGDSTLAAMAPYGLANYLVPLFHYCRNVQGVFVPAQLSWTGSWYVGVGAIALAILGGWRSRDGRSRLLVATLLFSLVMALGHAGLLYDTVRSVLPFLGLIRFPIKFVVLATFALPLLAALGLSRIERSISQNSPTDLHRLKWIAFVLVGLMAVILGFAWKFPLPKDDFNATLVSALSRAGFLLVTVLCLFWLCRASYRLQVALQIALVALSWADVLSHGSNLSPTVPAASLEPDAIRNFYQWADQLRPGTSRAMLSKGSLRAMLMAGSENAEIDTQGRRLSLYMNYNLLDGVPKFDGFYSLDLREFYPFRNLYFITNDASGFKDFIGISQVNSSTNITEWLPRRSFLPIVTAGQRPVFGDLETARKAVLGDDFQPLQVVYLPVEAQANLRVNAASRVEVLAREFSTHKVKIEARADAPAMVVIAQAYYHNWQASVDRSPARLWPANGGFQALEIPPGKHTVNLVYEDSAFRWGAALSVACLLGCAGVWFLGGQRREGQPTGKTSV